MVGTEGSMILAWTDDVISIGPFMSVNVVSRPEIPIQRLQFLRELKKKYLPFLRQI